MTRWIAGAVLAALVPAAFVACEDSGFTPLAVTEAGPPIEAGAEWRTVLDHLEGALLSIWGTSARDVWTVGGALGNGGDALVLHFDGAAWHRLAPGRAESFWWVHGTSTSDVWIVGERGRITHWNGSAFADVSSGTDATLFGVWAAAPDDAWAVGGTPDQPSAPNDVLLHWDGAAWKAEALPTTNKVAFFKVWAASKDDLYVVGEGGIIWHKSAGLWKREGEGLATGRLTTVAGCSATEIYAVGGRDLLVSNGAAWSKAPIDPLTVVNDLNGVSCNAGHVVVVGGGSLKLRLVSGAWVSDFGSNPLSDLHGAWADETGAFWGVGGQFLAAARPGASRQGVVGRWATNIVPGTIAP